MPAYLWFLFTVLLPSLPTPTEDGVPYIVSIFAENSAGNGTKCNVTDFTNELGESCNTYNQCCFNKGLAFSSFVVSFQF